MDQTIISTRKTILYIAASLDGYIAKTGDNLDFLSIVEKEGEDYGYHNFISSVDTVILGRRTYDWVMAHVPEFVHADKTTFIVTRTPRPAIGNASFYTGDLNTLIAELKGKPGKNIFIDGGAQVVDMLLKEHLIDEMIISLIPILLGEGIRLFQDGRPEELQELVSTKQFDTGLVQLHYKKRNVR